MLGTHSLGVFAATVFVVNATPGVDMMLTLTRTLRHGVAGGIAAALGVVAGCVVHTLVAAFGLAALLAASATAFAALKWAGAVYLLWLAVGMLRASASAGHSAGAWPDTSSARSGDPLPGGGATIDAMDTTGATHAAHAAAPADPTKVADVAPAPGVWRLFRQGVLTNVLNPKVAIFFLALLPQFIDAGAADKLLAFLFLGAWFVVQSAFFLVAFVLMVAPLRRWRASPAWRRGLNASGAAIFVWLAARLALVERA
jgi:threonine/homoserine/homoserine lactone efflux protein